MAEPPDKDPLFDDVERWRNELDEQWIERFGRIVIALFLVGLACLILAVIVGCQAERPPDTLVPLSSYTTTICTNRAGTTFPCYIIEP